MRTSATLAIELQQRLLSHRQKTQVLQDLTATIHAQAPDARAHARWDERHPLALHDLEWKTREAGNGIRGINPRPTAAARYRAADGISRGGHGTLYQKTRGLQGSGVAADLIRAPPGLMPPQPEGTAYGAYITPSMRPDIDAALAERKAWLEGQPTGPVGDARLATYKSQLPYSRVSEYLKRINDDVVAKRITSSTLAYARALPSVLRSLATGLGQNDLLMIEKDLENLIKTLRQNINERGAPELAGAVGEAQAAIGANPPPALNAGFGKPRRVRGGAGPAAAAAPAPPPPPRAPLDMSNVVGPVIDLTGDAGAPASWDKTLSYLEEALDTLKDLMLAADKGGRSLYPNTLADTSTPFQQAQVSAPWLGYDTGSHGMEMGRMPLPPQVLLAALDNHGPRTNAWFASLSAPLRAGIRGFRQLVANTQGGIAGLMAAASAATAGVTSGLRRRRGVQAQLGGPGVTGDLADGDDAQEAVAEESQTLLSRFQRGIGAVSDALHQLAGTNRGQRQLYEMWREAHLDWTDEDEAAVRQDLGLDTFDPDTAGALLYDNVVRGRRPEYTPGFAQRSTGAMTNEGGPAGADAAAAAAADAGVAANGAVPQQQPAAVPAAVAANPPAAAAAAGAAAAAADAAPAPAPAPGAGVLGQAGQFLQGLLGLPPAVQAGLPPVIPPAVQGAPAPKPPRAAPGPLAPAPAPVPAPAAAAAASAANEYAAAVAESLEAFRSALAACVPLVNNDAPEVFRGGELGLEQSYVGQTDILGNIAGAGELPNAGQLKIWGDKLAAAAFHSPSTRAMCVRLDYPNFIRLLNLLSSKAEAVATDHNTPSDVRQLITNRCKAVYVTMFHCIGLPTPGRVRKNAVNWSQRVEEQARFLWQKPGHYPEQRVPEYKSLQKAQYYPVGDYNHPDAERAHKLLGHGKNSGGGVGAPPVAGLTGGGGGVGDPETTRIMLRPDAKRVRENAEAWDVSRNPMGTSKAAGPPAAKRARPLMKDWTDTAAGRAALAARFATAREWGYQSYNGLKNAS